MAVYKQISIDSETVSMGQYDRQEKYKGKLVITLDKARLTLGYTTVDVYDLLKALEELGVDFDRT